MTITSRLGGQWSAVRSVTSSPNSTTDYQPFVLVPDSSTTTFVPVTLALVHSNSAQCENAWTVGSSQTVDQSIGGAGHQYTWSNVTQMGPQWPGWGNDSGIELEYTATGRMSEVTRSPENAWVTQYDGAAAAPSTTTDWLSDASFNYGQPGPNYIVWEVPTNFHPSNPSMLTWTQTSTYSSTSGTDYSVDVSVCFEYDTPAGAGFGMCAGTSVTLTDTTTDVYTTQATLSCEMYDPSSTQTAVYYYTFGDGTTCSVSGHVAA